jgi:hypothetical protein
VNIWAVKKAVRKSYGYRLVANQWQSYLFDGFSMGWYRYKRDALKRASELNA